MHLAVGSLLTPLRCRVHAASSLAAFSPPLPAAQRQARRQWRRLCAEDDGEPASSDFALPLSALQSLDLNQLQTALNLAIAAENYALASKLRNVIALLLGPDTAAAAADWRRLGILDWLADRAEDLGFRLPTEVQRRAAPVIIDRDDCTVESETGSGKTLAFLLPALSLLDFPPAIYPEDLPGPQLVVLVPTRELGVQAVMLIYKLFGGSVNPGVPGERANMFRYHGPRGLRVKGLLLASEVELAVAGRYLLGAHVVVGTPELIQEAMGRGVQVVQHCRVIAMDEADACFSQHPQETAAILEAALSGGGSNFAPTEGHPVSASASSEPLAEGEAPGVRSAPRQRPVVVLVGATVDEALVERAVVAGWLQDPVRVGVGERMRVPRGLRHRYIVCSEAERVGAMCRQLRADLSSQSPDAAPARVMVFAASEAQARALSDPLRTVLWGEHKIAVLLPEGTEPITALHSFRDNKTTLLLATPAAARGLDLPAVTHVYNVAPTVSAADYLHRAGRAGRIGSTVPGTVTTLVAEEELAGWMGVAAELGLELERIEAPAPACIGGAEGDVDVESVRRALEDILALAPSEPQQRGGAEAGDGEARERGE